MGFLPFCLAIYNQTGSGSHAAEAAPSAQHPSSRQARNDRRQNRVSAWAQDGSADTTTFDCTTRRQFCAVLIQSIEPLRRANRWATHRTADPWRFIRRRQNCRAWVVAAAANPNFLASIWSVHAPTRAQRTDSIGADARCDRSTPPRRHRWQCRTCLVSVLSDLP